MDTLFELIFFFPWVPVFAIIAWDLIQYEKGGDQ